MPRRSNMPRIYSGKPVYEKIVRAVRNKGNLVDHIWKSDSLRKLIPPDVEIEYPTEINKLLEEITHLVRKMEDVIRQEKGDHIIGEIRYGMELFHRCVVDVEQAVRARHSIVDLRNEIIKMIAFLIKFAIDIHYLNRPLMQIIESVEEYDDELELED